MPIKVLGTTDVKSVPPGGNTGKPVCIVASATTATDKNKAFQVFSTTDAETKWGAGSVASKLAGILLKNGVPLIYGIIPSAPSEGTLTKVVAYDNAMTELLRYPDIQIVITDEVDTSIHAKVRDHMDLAGSQDIFRYGVVGLNSSDSALLGTAASALNSERMFLAGNNVLDSDGTVMSGIYSAAGLASLISVETDDPALPMNGVSMMGFSGNEKVLLTTEKDALVNAGVTPLYSNAGKPTVYRLVTTYTKDANAQADPTWQEGTTMFITDDVLSSCQKVIRSNYKRTKNVARILNAMRTDIISVLQTKNDLEIIENFDPKLVSVVKDPNDIYGALIDYEYDVVTPLYTVTIRQHMVL
jgi:phage tail sheath gpL-like